MVTVSHTGMGDLLVQGPGWQTVIYRATAILLLYQYEHLCLDDGMTVYPSRTGQIIIFRRAGQIYAAPRSWVLGVLQRVWPQTNLIPMDESEIPDGGDIDQD